MKAILYSLILLLSTCILYLLSIIVERPFSTLNMAQAYNAGCIIGGMSTPDKTLIKCNKLSLTYKETLDDLMSQ